jgi:hypothetical protein
VRPKQPLLERRNAPPHSKATLTAQHSTAHCCAGRAVCALGAALELESHWGGLNCALSHTQTMPAARSRHALHPHHELASCDVVEDLHATAPAAVRQREQRHHPPHRQRIPCRDRACRCCLRTCSLFICFPPPTLHGRQHPQAALRQPRGEPTWGASRARAEGCYVVAEVVTARLPPASCFRSASGSANGTVACRVRLGASSRTCNVHGDRGLSTLTAPPASGRALWHTASCGKHHDGSMRRRSRGCRVLHCLTDVPGLGAHPQRTSLGVEGVAQAVPVAVLLLVVLTAPGGTSQTHGQPCSACKHPGLQPCQTGLHVMRPWHAEGQVHLSAAVPRGSAVTFGSMFQCQDMAHATDALCCSAEVRRERSHKLGGGRAQWPSCGRCWKPGPGRTLWMLMGPVTRPPPPLKNCRAAGYSCTEHRQAATAC